MARRRVRQTACATTGPPAIAAGGYRCGRTPRAARCAGTPRSASAFACAGSSSWLQSLIIDHPRGCVTRLTHPANDAPRLDVTTTSCRYPAQQFAASLRYAECRANDRLFIPDGVYSQIGHDSLEYQWKVPPTDADAQHWHRTRPTHSRSLAQHYNAATAARPWTLYRVDQATSTLPPGTHWRSESDWDCPLQQLTRSRHGTVTRERHWHGHGVSATSRVTSRG